MLRDWLEEKLAKGVKQVRVASVLERLNAEQQKPPTQQRRAGQPRNGKVTITPDDLLGASEVAEFLGVDRTRPSKWQINHTTFGPMKTPFPAPYKKLATGPVWLRSQIEPLIPFVEERRRQPRPKKTKTKTRR